MSNKVTILELSLHQHLVGYLAGFQNGRNVLVYADSYKHSQTRPTLGLITSPVFPNSTKLLGQDWITRQRLHPVLSNLLPEGALRALLTQGLKIHGEHEFQLFAALSHDLPGALIARPLMLDQIPVQVQTHLSLTHSSQIEALEITSTTNKFSLAGIQMKFSMREQGGRFTLAHTLALDDTSAVGDWIIKTPSTQHAHVPLNEYSAMRLAQLAGIDIPEIKLVKLSQLDQLPPLNLPQEQYAFAIKRFDRLTISDEIKRVHMEDFAQVLSKYPHEKYSSANYEQIGRVIYQFSGNPLKDIQQFARRLLVNILLANGDAHLKNWSLTYPDQVIPRLSPAYDILTTQVYIDGERQFALNLAKNKDWYVTEMRHFQYWAEKVGVPWRIVKPHLDDVMDKARTLWPVALNDLPMIATHQKQLKAHWQRLSSDFKI